MPHEPTVAARRGLWFCIAAAFAFAPDAGGAMNLLFMGNSYTQRNDVPASVAALAVAEGYAQPLIVADLEGGKDLDYHADRVAAHPANNIAHPTITGQTFDYAILQGQSTEATHRNADDDFVPDALALAELIRGGPTGGGAAVVLYQTWARAPFHSFYPDDFANPDAMHDEIRTNYAAAADAINAAASATVAGLAPVGDAFAAAGYATDLYDPDGSHANVLGSRLAGLVIYRTLYGETVSDIAYGAVSGWAGVSETDWGRATAWADAIDITPIPEPTTAAALALGAAGLRRRRRGSRT